MKTSIAFLLASVIAVAPTALAVPRATDRMECAVFADMMLVAAAAARVGIPLDKTSAAIRMIYDIEDPRTREIAGAIVVRAFTGAEDPSQIAGQLLAVCTSKGGDMSSVLGVGT